MFKRNGKKQIGLFIESPLVIGGMEIILSESRLELERDKNLMIHCEKLESGFAFVRAILGLEKLSRGKICIKKEEKEFWIDRKRNVDFSGEQIRMAYVSEDGSDYCHDLTMKENLNLIKAGNDPDFNERIQQLAAEFSVEENLDDLPSFISTKRRKIYSIIRAWAYLSDIIVYSNPLEHLDDLSSIEILRNFAIPKGDLTLLNVVYTPSIGEFSNVLHNFHLIEIIH